MRFLLLIAEDMPFCSYRTLSKYSFAVTSNPYLSSNFRLKSLKIINKPGNYNELQVLMSDFSNILPI